MIISCHCNLAFSSTRLSHTESPDSLACRQIHQAARQAVELPTTVIAACIVTNHDSDSALSKKCQVQAHMALTKDGSMPNDRARQAVCPVTVANNQMNQMAAIHSITLVIWTIQVGIERACISLID